MRRYHIHYSTASGWNESATIEADTNEYSSEGDKALLLLRGDEIVAKFTEFNILHWYFDEIPDNSSSAFTTENL